MKSQLSDTIRLARVLCILLLVYAHAQPYSPGVPTTVFSQEGTIYFLRLLLGQGSVPLLSVVSGYLLAKSMSERRYTDELKNKLFTLIVPLVLWNLIYIFKEFLKLGLTGIPAASDWPNAVLAISAPPAMMPLYFLRDVFVCFLMSPLLFGAARKAPLLTITALLINAVLNADGPLFINSGIPLFFFGGCLLWSRAVVIPTDGLPKTVVAASIVTLVVLSIAPIYGYAPPGWSLLAPHSTAYGAAAIALFVASSVVFWHAACLLRGHSLGRFLMLYEPIAFFIFCIHAIVAGVWWIALVRTGLVESSVAVLAYFISTPLLVLVSSVVAIRIGIAVAPVVLKPLLGGRVPTPVQVSRMLRPNGETVRRAH